jgi:hypothetical protein
MTLSLLDSALFFFNNPCYTSPPVLWKNLLDRFGAKVYFFTPLQATQEQIAEKQTCRLVGWK